MEDLLFAVAPPIEPVLFVDPPPTPADCTCFDALPNSTVFTLNTKKHIKSEHRRMKQYHLLGSKI